MNFALPSSASFAILFHVSTVVPAAFLGAFLLAGPKGTPSHRLLGKVWLLLMVGTSLSTFFIHEIRLIGDFSPIHLLSVFVIAGSFRAVAAARRRDIVAHRRHVAGMYLGGIVIAGLFTFVPGRLMYAFVFSDITFIGAVLAALFLCLSFGVAARLALREMVPTQTGRRRKGLG